MNKKKTEKLNTKRALFVKAYTTNGYNAYQAALTAGYSKHIARTAGLSLISRPEVYKAIHAAKVKQFSKIEADAKFIMDGFKEIALTAPKESDRANALREIAKLHGLYELDNFQSATKVVIKTEF